MKFLSATSRLTFGLICLSLSTWLLAFALGLLPDRQQAVVSGRAALCESVALHCSLMASRNDHETIETSLQSLAKRNREIVSAGIRRSDRTLWVSVGDHQTHWSLPVGSRSTDSQMRLPILAGDEVWGFLEVQFRPLAPSTSFGWLTHPLLSLGAFIGSASCLMFFFYLSKMLRHLDPTKVIPSRVRATLDTLAEGLLVLDQHERILLANRSFAESLGASPDELTGRKASELPWEADDNHILIEGYPWIRAIENGLPQTGELLTIRDKNHEQRVLKVSAAPVYADDGHQRGAMASFDDVTQIEQNRAELRQMLDALSHSRDEIHRQNVELERLAAHDPLTTCLNRRAMLSQLEKHWSGASLNGDSLACIMVDLDHFKLINDTHGHQMGDQVLETTGRLLKSGRRATDLVCRYGGEEFCVLLPHTNLDAAHRVAEQIRAEVEAQQFDNLRVTASIGVSARSLGAADPQSLINQADKCLYVAKRQGRNCVIRFDNAQEEIAQFEADAESAGSTPADTRSASETLREAVIPFHAVTALVSALAYRDPSTADHSRRVADLCVQMADRLSLQRESFVLETAALLHDIGKIGVPDVILLKPGGLTEEEWEVMKNHERIGVEIIETTFSCPQLTEVMRTYRAWFGGDPKHPQLPSGDEIPLSARILAIADAYDAMTSAHAYRDRLSRLQAFTELRRCAGRQFDPDLVEQFIDLIANHDNGLAPPAPHVAKDAVLSFGAQIARLADTVDKKDLGGLVALSRRLRLTAVKYEVEDIAQVAEQLERAAGTDCDIKQVVRLMTELLELCRDAQRSYLEDCYGRTQPPTAAGDVERSRGVASCS